MTFYYNDCWLGYLSENIVRECIKKSKKNCSGCIDDMKSSILHLHEQLSLLEKLKKFFEVVRAELLNNILSYYSQFESKLPHSDDKAKDKVIYSNVARHFLITCTAESIYFGRYITEHNDGYIYDGFKIPSKK